MERFSQWSLDSANKGKFSYKADHHRHIYSLSRLKIISLFSTIVFITADLKELMSKSSIINLIYHKAVIVITTDANIVSTDERTFKWNCFPTKSRLFFTVTFTKLSPVVNTKSFSSKSLSEIPQ